MILLTIPFLKQNICRNLSKYVICLLHCLLKCGFFKTIKAYKVIRHLHVYMLWSFYSFFCYEIVIMDENADGNDTFINTYKDYIYKDFG